MGVHVTAVAVKGSMAQDPVAFLSALGLKVAAEVTETSEQSAPFASNGPGCQVGVCLCSDWSLVSGDLYPPSSVLLELPAEELAKYKTLDFLHERLARVSAGSRALCFVLESTSGTYGFDWFEGGVLRRSRWEIEGELVRDEGAPLFEDEAEIIDQLQEDEMALYPLLERLTTNFDTLGSCSWRTFRVDWSSNQGLSSDR